VTPNGQQPEGGCVRTVLFDGAFRVLVKFNLETAKIELANNIVLI
jgi:hypothetical protein